MNGSINIDVLPGTAILDAANEAQNLADRIGITIKFDFNGVLCRALVGGDAGRLADNFMSKMGSDSEFKMASSR